MKFMKNVGQDMKIYKDLKNVPRLLKMNKVYFLDDQPHPYINMKMCTIIVGYKYDILFERCVIHF